MLVRIADLTVNEDLLTDLTFENCSIVGPAVIAVLGGNEFLHCAWDGAVESIF